jgi:hypothetical protein
MNALKDLKAKIITPPQLKNNGAFASNTYFDTAGVGASLVLIVAGVIDAIIGSTDTAHALKVEECDTTDGTYSDVSGAALSAVIAATDDGKMYGIHIDHAKTHKRYMRVNAPTAGNGTTGCNAAIVVIQNPLDESPGSAAKMGMAEFIQA